MAKVSVLIPARNEPYLNKTIDDIFAKAAGEIEVLVMLDGVWPKELPADRPNLVLVHNSEPRGIGHASAALARLATGQYIMKTDAHCMYAEGFDEALKADCDYDWLAVPSRYQLKDEPEWHRGYGPIDYLYVTYPWIGEPQFGAGMHGKKWLGEHGLEGEYFWIEKHKKATPIDDIMTFQGSCWFMHRERYLELGGVDERYWLWQEAQSIGMKVWLSGGRCVVNKKTWYAHLHKGQRHGRGYRIAKQRAMDDNMYSANFWMRDKWQHPLKVRGIEWFAGHFWPIPGWPDDWQNERYEREFVYPGIEKAA